MKDVRFSQATLPNGSTLVCETVPDARSLAIGLWLRAGSRDERPVEDGVAHFVEHLAFKGTQRRSAFEIARSLEAEGGSLDAFTGREITCYYARVLSESLPLAVDVVCDLVSHPLFLDDHVEKEKAVVLEEIRGLEDAPEDLVHDLVAARLWQGHPLAGTILGTETSVQSFNSGLVRGFYERLYRNPGAVISMAGGFELAEATDLLSARLELSAAEPAIERTRPHRVSPALINYQRDVSQEYLCLATYTPPFGDKRRYALQILSTVLGGGMSSRLFQSIREESGLAYSVYSYTDFCHDTGLFCSALAVSRENSAKALDLTLAEFERLRRNGFTEAELNAAKAQVRGGVVMGLESLSSRMNRLAKSHIYNGCYQPVDDLMSCFERLTVADVMEQAGEFLNPEGYTLVAYGPAGTAELNRRPWTEVEEK